MFETLQRILHFPKVEHRQSYTQTAVDAAIAAATGAPIGPDQTTAAVIGIRAIADGFAMARPTALADLLGPDFLRDVATRLMLTGNYVALINLDQDGGIELIPASTFEVAGRSFQQDTWAYRLELPAPSSHEPIKRVVPRAGVVHIKIGAYASRPWLGISPLAHLGAQALGSIEASLRDDSRVPTGGLLPMPDGISQRTVDAAANAVRTGKGGLQLVETTAGGMGLGQSASPAKDWQQVRFGPQHQQNNILFWTSASQSILESLGVPQSIFRGDGAAQIAAYRFMFYSRILPLGRVASMELSRALGLDLSLDFESCAYRDVQRLFKSGQFVNTKRAGRG